MGAWEQDFVVLGDGIVGDEGRAIACGRKNRFRLGPSDDIATTASGSTSVADNALSAVRILRGDGDGT